MGVRLLEMRRKGLLSSGGKIVYWNQLLPNFSSTYYTHSGSAATPTITYDNNIVTITYPQDTSGKIPRAYALRTGIPLLYNNKYYLSMKIRTSVSSRWKIYTETSNPGFGYNNWAVFKTIYTSSSQTNQLVTVFQPLTTLTAGTYCSLQIPIVVNLTQMFGAGN